MKIPALTTVAKHTLNYLRLYWLVYISALLLAAAAQLYTLGWLTLIALVPLLAFVKQAHKRGWTQHDKLNMFLGGVVMYISVLGWIPQSDPVTWTPTEGSEARFALYCFYLLMILCFSLSWLALAYILAVGKRWIGKSELRLYLLFALGLVSVEWLRAFIVSIVIWAPDSTTGAQWGLGNLGFLASATPIVVLGRTVGVYGLTLVVVAINVGLLELLKRNFKLVAIIILSLGVLAAASILPYQQTGTVVSVGAVQLNAQRLEKYMPGLSKVAKDSQLDHPLDLLVTPEYFDLFEMEEASDRAEALSILTKPETIIIATKMDKASGRPHPTNRQTYYDPTGKILHWNDKVFLVPGGEYLPSGTELGLKILGNGSLVDEFSEYKAISKGLLDEKVYSQGVLRIGSLVCSGVVSPIQYQKLSKQSPNIITNSASLGIFGDGQEYFEQAKQMARFHAVALNKPFVQSAAHSTSYMIDRNGNWIARSTQPDQPVELITARVELSSSRTLYSYLGSTVAYIALVATTVILTVSKLRNRKK